MELYNVENSLILPKRDIIQLHNVSMRGKNCFKFDLFFFKVKKHDEKLTQLRATHFFESPTTIQF